MPTHNKDIADIFNSVADLLDIRGESQYRVRAYRSAARTIEGLSRSAADMIEQGEDLSKLSGIGKDLAGKIEQIVDSGRLPLLEQLKADMPGELGDLMRVPGLGPKRVARLHDELDVTTLDDLEEAAEQGRISEMEGLGKKTEERIAEEVSRMQQAPEQRLKLARAEQIAEPLVEYLGEPDDVKDIIVAGSYRRRKETVGDLDILATCKRGSDIMERFTGYEDVRNVVSKGETRSTVVLRSGLQVDLRVVPQVSFGAALQYFTGSKDHSLSLRRIAQKRKLKLNEYGVFKGDERVAGRTEEEVYAEMGLSYIEPELRENRGEVEAARKKNQLPDLVTLEDIRGDLHVHTKRTDGHHAIEELVAAAGERGYSYIAISDHSQRVTVAHGLKPKQLREQMAEIDAVNRKDTGVTVLKSIEVDILPDGSLDLPDDVLAELDLTVCSVHSKFDLTRKQQTKRICKAMENPHFRILGHPTGRLINEREAYDVDMEEIMKTAEETGCVLELNAHPDRLDLDDTACRMARDNGVKVAISTDTHRIDDLAFMRFGIGQARRGWLAARDVVNTSRLDELRELLQKK